MLRRTLFWREICPERRGSRRRSPTAYPLLTLRVAADKTFPGDADSATPVILVIDDDPLVSVVVRRALEGLEHRLFTAPDAATGVAEVEAKRPDLVVLDNLLPDGLGMEVIAQIHAVAPNVPVLFTTGRGSSGDAIEAMKRSAFDYLPKPLDPPRVRVHIDRALALRRLLRNENLAQPAGRSQPSPPATVRAEPSRLVGDCPAMQSVFKSIGRVSAQEVTVLIRGEHGTGKEATAREIHRHSRRAEGPLVSFACRGLDERRLDEELFGASDRTTGRLADAAGGTLVLHGVSRLTLPMQEKLLGVVRDGAYETASGGGTLRSVGCRLIAITTDDLEARSRAGEFRSDLYYLLSSFVINLPPIRQRHGDLRLLVENSLSRLRPIAEGFGVREPSVSDEAMRTLGAHLWPGNLDELDSVLRRALVEQNGNILLADDLIRAVPGDSVVAASANRGDDRTTTDWAAFADIRIEAGSDTLHADAVAEAEQKLFARLLRHTSGNQSRAAQILGITRASLRKKLRQYGMVAKPADGQ